MAAIRRFLLNEDGPTAVEYAVMLAMILVVCIGALRIFGTTAGGSFQDSATKINDTVGASN